MRTIHDFCLTLTTTKSKIMANPFEEITQLLNTISARLEALEKKAGSDPSRIPFHIFCKEYSITRQTGKAWADRGLIALEKVAGRLYVKKDSITLIKKYQREPIAA
jgi:hypothetical protein